jgi:hypothetical protein
VLVSPLYRPCIALVQGPVGPIPFVLAPRFLPRAEGQGLASFAFADVIGGGVQLRPGLRLLAIPAGGLRLSCKFHGSRGPNGSTTMTVYVICTSRIFFPFSLSSLPSFRSFAFCTARFFVFPLTRSSRFPILCPTFSLPCVQSRPGPRPAIIHFATYLRFKLVAYNFISY